MALTPSSMVPLGTTAPDFSLPNFNAAVTPAGELMTLKALQGNQGTLVMFICNHCPYVKHIQKALGQLGKDYAGSGIQILAINANDAEHYPDDAPDKMTLFAAQNHLLFPYLYDENQRVAKDYAAACTPDFFLFNGLLECVYRGQFDGSRPGNDIPVTGNDLRKAMNCLLDGQPISSGQQPSIGCNIKWKS